MSVQLHKGLSVRLSSRVATHFRIPTSNEESPAAPHPCQHLILLDFFILAVLAGMKWYFTVVSISISLMTND